MSRGRLVPIVVVTLLIGLMVGRWWAVGTADRLWAEALGADVAHGSIARVRALLFMAAFLSACVWCLGNLYLVHRTIGSVHVPRRLGNLEITEALPRHYLSIGFIGFGIVLALAMSIDARGWWHARALASGGALVGLSDPILQRDASYYLFTLPWRRIIHGYATILAAIMFAVSLIAYVAVGAVHVNKRRIHLTDATRRHLGAVLAVFALTLVWGYRLEPAEYVAGVHNIPFDSVLVDVRIPTARLLGAIGLMTCVVSLLWIRYDRVTLVMSGWGALVVLSFVGHYLVPAVAAGVRTDEELQSDAMNSARADFMKYAYGLDANAEHDLPAPTPTLRPASPPDLDAPLIWDEFAVSLLLKRVARDEPHLDFADATVGQYGTSDGQQLPVIIGVREVDLNAARRTDPAFSWERVHLAPYRSGKGVVAVRADVSSEGGHPLFVVDLQHPDSVVSTIVDAAVHDPTVLFGIATDEFAVVPAQQAAVGVPAGGLLRRLALAWRLQSSRVLTSSAVTGSSVVLWHRSVADRLEAFAPFADFGAATPMVIDGQLFWTAYGYVTSRTFPLSSRVAWRERGVGYLRAGFVGVVEAATGETNVYALPGADPLSSAWAELAPDIVSPWNGLARAVRGHLRYPEELFRNQVHLLRDPQEPRRPGFFGRLRPRPGPVPLGDEPFWWLGRTPRDSLVRLRLHALLQTGEPPHLNGMVEGSVTDWGPSLTVQRIAQPWNLPAPARTVGRFAAQRGADAGVAGPLKMVSVGSEMFALQTTYRHINDPARTPELASIAVQWGEAVGEAPDLDDALDQLTPSGRNALPEWGNWAAARRWFQRLDAARQSGDWTEFGRAYEELQRLLTTDSTPGR